MKLSLILNASNLTKVYRQGSEEVRAINDISLELRGGDFVAIMGPSGSGKSTLLHILGCLDQPTQGELEIEGEIVSTIRPAQLWRTRNQKIGFVFQNHYLIESLNALENVMLPLKYAGFPLSLAKHKAKEMLRKVGLEKRITHQPGQLSGGEKARVAISRALINDPILVLADEPTGELDSKTGEAVLKLLKENCDQSKVFVLVTHDQQVAQECQRIIRMHDGAIASVD